MIVHELFLCYIYVPFVYLCNTRRTKVKIKCSVLLIFHIMS